MPIDLLPVQFCDRILLILNNLVLNQKSMPKGQSLPLLSLNSNKIQIDFVLPGKVPLVKLIPPL